jgi:hypothetical protein
MEAAWRLASCFHNWYQVSSRMANLFSQDVRLQAVQDSVNRSPRRKSTDKEETSLSRRITVARVRRPGLADRFISISR